MSIVGRVPLAESPDEQTREIKRIVVSSILGTAVEWYDFLIYGTASALVFNKLFFPFRYPCANNRDQAHRCLEHPRYGGRVVRFSDLRYRERARLQQAVLSVVQSHSGHHRCVRHLRCWFPGPPARRRDLRTFW